MSSLSSAHPPLPSLRCRPCSVTSCRMTFLWTSVVVFMTLQQQQQQNQATAFSLMAPSLRRKSSSFFHASPLLSPTTTTTTTTTAAVRSLEWRKFLVERRIQSSETSSSSSLSSSDNNNNNTNEVDIIALTATNQQQQQQQQPLKEQGKGGLVPPFKVTIEGDDYSYKDAITRTLGWVGAATIFGGGIWATAGSEMGQEFFAGYMVEQSLSVDNLFVFLLLFEYFKIPLQYQDRVLNWGIYGAIIMRAIMIGLGVAALENFRQVLLVFAAILVYGSGKFFIGQLSGNDDDDEEEDPSQNSIIKLARSLYPSTDTFDGNRFFTLVNGIRTATPLLICCIAVEISDVVFAVDSIPAVFGVTEDPLIVFSSNIFAIMGLRSLYTILSKAATDLKYLEPAVALVLGFIGGKMIAEYLGYIIPTSIALGVVGTLLSAGVGLSVLERRNENEKKAALVEDSMEP